MKYWISRDADDMLHLHSTKPEKLNDDFWTSFYRDGQDYIIDYRLFPEVTFENSPQMVEIKLI